MVSTISTGEKVQTKGVYECVDCGEPARFNKSQRQIGALDEFWAGSVMRRCFNPSCGGKTFKLRVV